MLPFATVSSKIDRTGHVSRLRVSLWQQIRMTEIEELVVRAQSGDLEAFGRLVERTQALAYGAAVGVLRDPGLAQDATQDAFLRAYRRLADLQAPELFLGWLRRIVISVALNSRRRHRYTLLQLDDMADVPILDEREERWSELQRLRLASALVTLTPADRRLCDRRYHGRWTAARLAQDAGVDENTMRKRLQRVRDKLRKEIEMSEQRHVRPGDLAADLPAKVLELLARPTLTDLPENPVGRILEELRLCYAEFAWQELPEIIDFSGARTTIGDAAMYIGAHELHRVDDSRILRYDLTLPLLLNVRYQGTPLRLLTAGKAYRLCQADATHLEAFHQAEAFCLDTHAQLDPWTVTARVLRSIDRILPGRSVKIVPTAYQMCKQAWELEVEHDGVWTEVLAWGVFSDRIVEHVGGDPVTHTAIGVGYGLERLAMVRYGIRDIRTLDVMTAA